MSRDERNCTIALGWEAEVARNRVRRAMVLLSLFVSKELLASTT